MELVLEACRMMMALVSVVYPTELVSVVYPKELVSVVYPRELVLEVYQKMMALAWVLGVANDASHNTLSSASFIMD